MNPKHLNYILFFHK